jgi:Spy/CpxP family protein refolding chaperone
MKTVASLVFILVVLFTSHSVMAQEKSTHPSTAPCGKHMQKGHHHGGHPMMEKCKEMKAKFEQWTAMMKEMDDRLEKKVASMNAAKAEEKIDAMAAVINEMVVQRKERREKMMSMRLRMMCHMMEHMGPGCRRSMADCPMKEMVKAAEDKPGKE